jgi:hypothetical protein
MKNYLFDIIRPLTIACMLSMYISVTHAQITLELEGGVATTGYNDVRIPGDGGTLLRLSDELSSDPFLFGRARAGYTFNERNAILLLFAPLQVRYTGTLSKNVNFENVLFPPGTNIDATYKFNSYRISYRYLIVSGETISLGLGLTGKIRDAFIRLEGNGLRSEKDDLGFVPLINFRFDWQLSDRFRLTVDGDALAAPQGRAEDVLLALGYTVNKNIELYAGYRILEGGADNDEVYTFSLFHYGTLGVRIRPNI